MSESLTTNGVTITTTPDGGVIIKCNGGNRAVTQAELQKLALAEGPVTIR
jgi:hypothetical protein